MIPVSHFSHESQAIWQRPRPEIRRPKVGKQSEGRQSSCQEEGYLSVSLSVNTDRMRARPKACSAVQAKFLLGAYAGLRSRAQIANTAAPRAP